MTVVVTETCCYCNKPVYPYPTSKRGMKYDGTKVIVYHMDCMYERYPHVIPWTDY